MKLYERIENNNFDEIDKNRAIELIENGNGHLIYNENYFKLQKENKALKEENAQAWEEWNCLEQGSYETEQRLKKENKKLKEYIAIAQNLDEMTAIKYRNIQQDAYIQGRAEEQQKAEQIIYENYIPVQKVEDTIEEIQKVYNKLDKEVDEYINDANKDLSKYYENKEKIGEMQTLSWCIDNLQELLKKEDKL